VVSLESSGGPAVTFGLFDWVDADGVRDAGQLYRERLDLLADAESQGSTGSSPPCGGATATTVSAGRRTSPAPSMRAW
jgi:hypothetical protein